MKFKYYIGFEVKKLYLSAIPDLYDRRIIAYKIGDSNNNELVFHTFNEATNLYPGANPRFHRDRGYRYTSKKFHDKLVHAGMIQSMSRVGRCLDNAPMEGWWGIKGVCPIFCVNIKTAQKEAYYFEAAAALSDVALITL